jgi:hypothetical protein
VDLRWLLTDHLAVTGGVFQRRRDDGPVVTSRGTSLALVYARELR